MLKRGEDAGVIDDVQEVFEDRLALTEEDAEQGQQLRDAVGRWQELDESRRNNIPQSDDIDEVNLIAH